MKTTFLIWICLIGQTVSVWSWEYDPNDFDALGAPLDLVSAPVYSENFYSDLTLALPEQKNMLYEHPEYFSRDNSSIYLEEETNDVTVTFLHEGAGFKNAFGYLAVSADDKDLNFERLKKNGVILFPNASLKGSGGNLSYGDTVSLGGFPAHTTLLFFVIANGWNSNKSLKNTNWVFATDMDLNSETGTMNNISNQQHVAMLWHEESQVVVLGMEDVHREQSWCDHDFNDAIFTVSSDPIGAIRSEAIVRLPDAEDLENLSFSYSPAKDQTGTLAFEDLWPRQGDFDFNDVVVQYYVILTKKDGLVTRIQYDALPQAMGAALDNNFAVKLNVPLSNIETVVHLVDGRSEAIQPRSDGEGTILEFANSFANVIPPPSGYDLSNTLLGSPKVTGKKMTVTVDFKTGVDIDTLGAPPFDSYISHDSGGELIEIHLSSFPPTDEASRLFFGGSDDASDFENGQYYQTSNHLPWAILIPHTWANPLEKRPINLAYPNIVPWAESAGNSHNTWYLENKQVEHLFP